MSRSRLWLVLIPLFLTACAESPSHTAPAADTTSTAEPSAVEPSPGPTSAAARPDRAVETTPPASPAPATTAPAASTDDADATTARFNGFEAPKPASWRAYPPENPMRSANYMLPAESGEPQAHVVVFQNIGGGVDMNIDRWIGQFRDDDGGPVEAHRETFEVAGMPVTYVELAGQYQGMGAAWPTPDQLFLAAIVEAPDGDLQIRLVGSRETVERHREAFLDMVRGLRPTR